MKEKDIREVGDFFGKVAGPTKIQYNEKDGTTKKGGAAQKMTP